MEISSTGVNSCPVGLEQFLLLSKTAKGAAAVELIKQVLEAPGIYVFGELLDMPNIRELATGPHNQYLQLLMLFAFGTLSEYKANQSQLPALSSLQLAKLRHLTIATLAAKNKCLPYALLIEELDLTNLRELEDVIIECICLNIICGKLDQKNNHVEVSFSIGRDVKPEQFHEMHDVLEEWCRNCVTLLHSIEDQIEKANERKTCEKQINDEIQEKLNAVRTVLRAERAHPHHHHHHHHPGDEMMSVDSVSRKAVKSKAGSSSSIGHLSPVAKASK